jgi:hypothetical protein
LRGTETGSIGRIVHDPRLAKAETMLRLGQRLGAL